MKSRVSGLGQETVEATGDRKGLSYSVLWEEGARRRQRNQAVSLRYLILK